MAKLELAWTDIDSGDEIVYSFPAVNEVCERCEGFGTHLNPSIGEHAYTAEEFNDSFDDDEKEEYFRRGGIYDVTCHACKGTSVLRRNSGGMGGEPGALLLLFPETLKSKSPTGLGWGLGE